MLCIGAVTALAAAKNAWSSQNTALMAEPFLSLSTKQVRVQALQSGKTKVLDRQLLGTLMYAAPGFQNQGRLVENGFK